MKATHVVDNYVTPYFGHCLGKINKTIYSICPLGK